MIAMQFNCCKANNSIICSNRMRNTFSTKYHSVYVDALHKNRAECP